MNQPIRGSKNTIQYPFQNPDIPSEERIKNLISLMSRDEKIQCLNNTGQVIPRLNIRTAGHVEGYHGAALGGPGKWGGDNEITTTQFCQAIGLGQTWDPDIVRKAAEVEAIEIRYVYHRLKRGGLVVRAPNADLGRDPRWGRNEECYGEDPYLNGTMSIAFIKGLQGEHPGYFRTASLLKHFLANSDEDNRKDSSSDFDERLFREYYSVPFRMGFIEGGARCYMTAYNAYNGIPCIVHPFIKNITMKEWGVDGIVCTDGGALGLLVTAHHYYTNNREAASACIKAGISQFLDPLHKEGINEAVESNKLTIEEIDEALKGNFRIMVRLGLFDPPSMVPYTNVGGEEPWNTEGHKKLARIVTQKSIVLLKNDTGILPLNRSAIKNIAVIGPRANEVLSDWYGGTPPYRVTPLDGIRNKAGRGVNVSYAAHNDNDNAVRIAGSADIVIICVGNHPTCHDHAWGVSHLQSEGKEEINRRTITMEQEDLNIIKQVYNVNQHIVVVLISSFPYAINWIQDHCKAIVHLTHSSQETGNALADVLFGDYNPAGRLVQTWPESIEHLPPITDYNIRNGRTYMYFKHKPLYHFGFGLSYTSFTYTHLTTSSDFLEQQGEMTIRVDIINTGPMAGEEVVQMYVKHLDSGVERPFKELKGFKRIVIQPGEKETVTMVLRGEDCAYWSTRRKMWVVESGNIQILIGSSSADKDVKLKKTIAVV